MLNFVNFKILDYHFKFIKPFCHVPCIYFIKYKYKVILCIYFSFAKYLSIYILYQLTCFFLETKPFKINNETIHINFNNMFHKKYLGSIRTKF